jgi:SAM-dependent methyltransferase
VTSFDDLVAEAAAAPIDGWDFSWLDGRATEERPPWGYSRLLGERLAAAAAALDLQSGGGEMLMELPSFAPLLVAAEGWLPNLALAGRRLRTRNAWAVGAADKLPFRDGRFDLVSSRHPVRTAWDEIARVLAPGGTYLSQQIGPDTNIELRDALLGPQPRGTSSRRPELAVAAANAAGLDVVDLREAKLRVTFDDIGAVVYFLRLVVWTVPDFDVDGYREALLSLHRRIEAEGPFVSYATRFLIEARKPTPR